MKSSLQFWDAIGIYNQSTIVVQIVIALLLLSLTVAVFISKNRVYQIALKAMFSFTFLWIVVVFLYY